jgi:hypothetical protein
LLDMRFEIDMAEFRVGVCCCRDGWSAIEAMREDGTRLTSTDGRLGVEYVGAAGL